MQEFQNTPTEALLLVDFLEMSTPVILIPILVSDGVPKGLPVGIDSVGDLGELVQHGVLAAAFGTGTAVVGGGRGEAAIGGLRWEREEKGRPLCRERNDKLLRREGERWCRNGRRSHERENERMDMRVVEEERDWEYTVCVENVK
ncbi:hypothetical protein JHK86_040209 [Glycine max]|nr:hypothetical protein JHK86_040209 [Glycine max]